MLYQASLSTNGVFRFSVAEHVLVKFVCRGPVHLSQFCAATVDEIRISTTGIDLWVPDTRGVARVNDLP